MGDEGELHCMATSVLVIAPYGRIAIRPWAGRCPPLCVVAVIDQPYPQSFDFSMLTSVGTG